MNLSIVTVNYRSWDHLEASLSALQPDFPSDWEMIVVDNESAADPLLEFESRFPWVKFVANPINSGFGFGCILGVERARGRYLLFLNPDVIASCQSIHALIAEYEAAENVAIIAPSQVDSHGNAQKVFDEFPGILNQSKTLKALKKGLLPNRHPDPRTTHKELVVCDWVTGSVLLIRRDHYDQIGGWSHDYWMYAEDADLCRRAANQGLLSAYTPKVEVIHAHGGSSRINVAVKSMTKLEVIISKHVYAANHGQGLSGPLMHAMIFLTRAPLLLLGSAVDLLTLRQVPTLQVRSRMLVGLIQYYAGVIASSSWLSPRAKANHSA